jgi:MFS family permease
MSSFFIIQQLSGIFLIFIFAAKFSLEAGVAMDEFLSTVIMGLIRVVMTFFISFAMNKYGRRQITILSSTGMLIAMIGLVICQLMSLNETPLPAVFLFGYCVFGVPGMLTLPFSMVADVYQQKSKSLGIGLNILICFVFAFITIKTCANVFEIFGSTLVFGFYAFMSAIGILFGIFILPETKGRNQQDMENYFKR